MSTSTMADAATLRELADWPCWEVGLYGFGDIYVEAPTAASARWWAASKCHEAGYGRSPIDLIQRGVSIRKVEKYWVSPNNDVHRVKRSALRARADNLQSEGNS